VIDDRFEVLLKHAIGLDAASIGAPAIERAVLERCALWHGDGGANLDAYWTALNASADELQLQIGRAHV
jgi:chemotaxis protein methyltransferase WspC